MPDPVKLALVIHFHQPVGNLDSVVRNATERCYRPFLEVLADHPEIKMTLHYSGCLLEWLEENSNEVTHLLSSLVDRGQVELMTGGFYEPILAALPHRDRVGQIRLLTEHLQDTYGAQPTGLWLTERVWEQDVVPALLDAGVAYTVVDDTMFHSVGVTDEQLVGAFVTEQDGRPLLVYAGDRRLRYLIPYKKVQRIIDHLAQGPRDRLFVYADDGEKFGEWPDTYERVYEKKWLREFFARLVDERDWIELTTLGDHAATASPVGRVYLGSSSYDEMMRWALPSEARLTLGRLRRSLEKDDPDNALPFVRGAPWRAFLAKYEEVNLLQKRMLQVSNAVHEAGAPDVALRALYKAQCNCAYWHGAFGGVYLGFMRGALWHHLMVAESRVQPKLQSASVEAVDLDADGHKEIVIRAPWGTAVVAPERGGMLQELDDWRVGGNVLASMARRREAYHLEDENPPSESDDDEDDEIAAIQARSDVEVDSLVFDARPPGGLIDVIDGAEVVEPYEWEVDNGGLARLWRHHDGLVLEKVFVADGDELMTTLRIENTTKKDHSGRFGVRTTAFPLNLGRESAPDHVEVTDLGWRVDQPDGELGLEVTSSVPGDISWEPVETASTSLEGLQTLAQGTTVTTEWELSLEPGAAFVVELRWRTTINPDVLHEKKERGVSA